MILFKSTIHSTVFNWNFAKSVPENIRSFHWMSSLVGLNILYMTSHLSTSLISIITYLCFALLVHTTGTEVGLGVAAANLTSPHLKPENITNITNNASLKCVQWATENTSDIANLNGCEPSIHMLSMTSGVESPACYVRVNITSAITKYAETACLLTTIKSIEYSSDQVENTFTQVPSNQSTNQSNGTILPDGVDKVTTNKVITIKLPMQ